MKVDIWEEPLKLGLKRRCVVCNQLILRQPKHGPKPKYCTESCRDRNDRKLRYQRYKDQERARASLWKQLNSDRVKALNDYHNRIRRERKQWKYNYMETLKI